MKSMEWRVKSASEVVNTYKTIGNDSRNSLNFPLLLAYYMDNKDKKRFLKLTLEKKTPKN